MPRDQRHGVRIHRYRATSGPSFVRVIRMKYTKTLVDKIPMAALNLLMLLITTVYLIIIGMYLPAAGTKQRIMKLGLIGLGLFACWRIFGSMKPAREEREAGRDS